jgi:hypothetical protein
MTDMTPNIEQNLLSVIGRIERASRKAGRDPIEITLVAASKTVDVKRVKEAINAGIAVLGENYVQEAQEKISKTKRHKAKWHFIGHLQKNKAKLAVQLFDMIETIDSPELAAEISKKAKTANKVVDILIEVNLAKEKTKAGIDPKKLQKTVVKIAALQNVKIKGLMAIPPYFEDPEMARPYFITLRRLAERINKERIPGVFLHELSMGMSHDFTVAIEEGATIIRVGTAIFGEREAKTKKGDAAKAKK